MKGWILYKDDLSELKAEKHEINRFIEQANLEGVEIEVLAPEEFELVVTSGSKKSLYLREKNVELPDFLIPRMGSNTTYFGLAAIRHLQRLGVFCVNSSEAIEKAKDKLYSHQILASANLPIPKTMLVKFPIDVDLVNKIFGFPVVIKTITGTQGNGVYLCEDPNKFPDLMNFIQGSMSKANIILQKYISTSKGRDLRVFVVGGRAIACMERRAKGDQFKANFSKGADVSEYKITPEIEWLATETARILKLDIAGVDLLFDGEHFKVCEANSSPGFRGIESCCDVNIPREIYNYVRIRLRKI